MLENGEFEDLGLDVWITLQWIFRNYMRQRIAYMRIRYGGSLLTKTIGLFSSLKFGDFLFLPNMQKVSPRYSATFLSTAISGYI